MMHSLKKLIRNRKLVDVSSFEKKKEKKTVKYVLHEEVAHLSNDCARPNGNRLRNDPIILITKT